MWCTETVDSGVHVIALRGIEKQFERLAADDQAQRLPVFGVTQRLKSDVTIFVFVARNGARSRRQGPDQVRSLATSRFTLSTDHGTRLFDLIAPLFDRSQRNSRTRTVSHLC